MSEHELRSMRETAELLNIIWDLRKDNRNLNSLLALALMALGQGKEKSC